MICLPLLLLLLFSAAAASTTMNIFNSLQRNNINSLHFDDGGSSGDENYFGEHTSDLSDTCSEDGTIAEKKMKMKLSEVLNKIVV